MHEQVNIISELQRVFSQVTTTANDTLLNDLLRCIDLSTSITSIFYMNFFRWSLNKLTELVAYTIWSELKWFKADFSGLSKKKREVTSQIKDWSVIEKKIFGEKNWKISIEWKEWFEYKTVTIFIETTFWFLHCYYFNIWETPSKWFNSGRKKWKKFSAKIQEMQSTTTH